MSTRPCTPGFAALLALAALPSAQIGEMPPPPGMVRIEGERVKIGTPTKEAIDLIKDNEGAKNHLAAETPQVEVKVASFFLMVSEVTNEQYLAFVRARGAKPPQSWGTAALNEARKAFLELQREKKLEAKARGDRFISTKFDPRGWWEQNWVGSEWKVPEDLLLHPVTWVNYQDAVDYASWAGLRLPTEFEFQAAGRGKTANRFPWGEEWEPSNANSMHSGLDHTQPVGSYPGGAVGGVFELIGNVWEWTESPFVAYKGYKNLVVDLGRGRGRSARKIEAKAPFDANWRVTVGGSFSTPSLACRLATRRGTDRFQVTDALGFRCALSTKPGRDMAKLAWTRNIPGDVLPEDLDYLDEAATILQRWTYSSPEGEQKNTAASNGAVVGTHPATPPGYAVITGYDAMLFVPAKRVSAANVKGLREHSVEEGPAHFGILQTTVPLLEPRLDVGTYLIAWRGSGEMPEVEPAEDGVEAADPAEEEHHFSQAPGFDPTIDQFLFFDATGRPVATLAATPLFYGKMLKQGRATLKPWVEPEIDPKEMEQEGFVPPTPMDTVLFRLGVEGRQRNKGFVFDLPLKLEPGVVDGDWK